MFDLQWFVIGTAVAKTINVAYPSPSWNTSLPVSMAKEFGLFAAEGLEVQPVYVRGGPVVMAALLGGDADFAVIAGVTAVTSIQRGADIVIVGGHTAYIDQVLIGAKGVTRLSELKGKVVGVTGSGGVTEFATVEALARKGLLRDKDYTILYSGNSPARVNALENGLIQAARLFRHRESRHGTKGLSPASGNRQNHSRVPFHGDRYEPAKNQSESFGSYGFFASRAK